LANSGLRIVFVSLLSVLLIGNAYAMRYDIQVVCEVRDGTRALQVVSYNSNPMPRLSAHVGGTAHLMGVRYIDQQSSTWLIEQNTGLSSYGRRICRLSSLPPGRTIVFPANMLFTISTGSEVGPDVERLVNDVVVNNTFIAFNGHSWYVNTIKAIDEKRNVENRIGDIRLSTWTTTSMQVSGQKLVARQTAPLYESVAPLIKGDRYLPLSAFSIIAFHAYGEPLPFDTGKFGSFEELRPVVERTMESDDFGRTWHQAGWRRLDH